MEQNGYCLITELQRFKQSSKEAVENTEEFNKFKKYLHIERPFEKELVKILRELRETSYPKLVMVCGSVGDGKSHLISYLKSTYKDLFDDVKIHNDATESFSPTQTSMDTLRLELDTFKDINIGVENGSHRHMVIAINLGTLSNFLNSEYVNEFTLLKNFVNEHKIIEDEQSAYEINGDSPFQFVNLSDFHLYELTENGIDSSLQNNLLEKIVGDNNENPFNKVYNAHCQLTCPVKDKCPVVKNYELLNNVSVRQSIIEQISELIIKYKVIISPRSYLDFLYRVLVHEKFDQLQSFEKIKKEINNQKDFDFLSALLPNLFYEYSKKSELFKDIENIQPDTIRLSQVDDLTLTFFNTTDIKGIYLNYISDKQLDKLNLIEILERFNPNDNKMQLLLFLTLLRLNRFLAEKSTIHIKDHVYEQYLSNLYHWNKKNIMGIRELYKDVIHSIYNWNGKAEKGKINRFIGRNQLKYTISQTIEVEPHLVKEEKRNEDKLEKFLNHMLLEFKVEGKILSITIDYHLFELINKMKYGYRPNNFDKNNFISFVDFVERIIKVGCNDDLIEFKNKVGNNIKSYSLSYDKTFGVYEFKENQL